MNRALPILLSALALSSLARAVPVPQGAGVPTAVPGSGDEDWAPLVAPAPLPVTPIPALSLGDPAAWDYWWAFNREPWLGLREAESTRVATGDDAFLSRESGEGPYVGRPHAGLVHERVVPAMLEALEEADRPELIGELLLALGRIGADPAGKAAGALEEVFVEHVGHADISVAESAVLALGILGRAGTVRTLEHLVDDCPQGRELCGRTTVPLRLRTVSAYALGLTARRSGHEDARRYAAMRLVHALEDRDVPLDLQVACVTALGLDPIAPRRGQAVGHVGHDLPSSSREALVAELLALLDDRDAAWQVQSNAVTALARLVEGLPSAAAEGGKDAEGTRERVIRRLMNAVRKGSDDPEDVRRSALIGLGRLGTAGAGALDAAVREALTRAAAQGPVTSRGFALVALARAAGRPGDAAGPAAGTGPARAELSAAVDGSNAALRSWAALALGLFERGVTDGRAAATSVELLEERLAAKVSSSERAAVGLALGLCGDADAYEALHGAFVEEHDDTAKGHLAVALGLLGDTRAIASLEDALEGALTVPRLYQECAIGLALLRERSLVPQLVERLGEQEALPARAAIAGALGYVGDARCVEALLALLEQGGADGVAAARALGRVCESDTLPWSTALASDLDYLAAPAVLTSGWTAVLNRR